ncbi:DNA-directed RNA polymerase I subunit 1 [Fagus crenata]
MKVSVVPFAVHDHKICSRYKLEMVLYTPENYPKNTDISLEDWEETLEVVFVRELEDAIQNHLLLLSKISGIKNFMPDSQSHASNGTDDDDVSGNRLQREEENDDDDDADGGGVSEDMGSDAQKRKQQSRDEMDYDDASEEEPNEEELSAGSESEIDLVENEIEVGKDDAIRLLDAKDISYETSGLEKSSKHKSKDKKNVSEAKKKKRARAKLVKKGFVILSILLGGDFRVLSVHITLYGQNNIPLAEKEKIPALQATGVDFGTFWQFQDVLDVRYVYSNSIHAMLTTYGVEAARATIIREIQHVFGSYGISVNMRHLTLIADYMTHSGGYRPMNRQGGIAESVSPFCKMSFETASKFIVEAACHGQTDELESPSARIILGLPVKVGTGCFDVMQKVEV